MRPNSLHPVVIRTAGLAGIVCFAAWSAISFTAGAQPLIGYQGVNLAPADASSSASASEGGGWGNGGPFTAAVDFGGTFMNDFHSTRFGPEGSFSMNPGVRMSLEGGYNLIKEDLFTLVVGAETGFIRNSFDSVHFAGNPTTYNGGLWQYPLLVEAILKVNLGPVIPYVGFGGGGNISTAAVHPSFNDNVWTYETDVNGAIQAQIGVRVRVWRSGAAGVGYKFLEDYSGHGDNLRVNAVFGTFSMDF